jgi:hypothetical protein
MARIVREQVIGWGGTMKICSFESNVQTLVQREIELSPMAQSKFNRALVTPRFRRHRLETRAGTLCHERLREE